MKDFLNELGGHPHVLDDLNQIKDGSFDRVAKVCQSLVDVGETFIVLDGTFSGSDNARTWTECSVFYNGGFYTLPEQTVAQDLTTLDISTSLVANVDQPVIYENGSPVNVRGEQTIVLVAGVGNAIALSNDKNIINLLIENQLNNFELSEKVFEKHYTTGWVNMDDAVDLTNWEVVESVEYKLTRAGNTTLIELRGQLDYISTNKNEPTVFTNDFPASIRPNNDKNCIAALESPQSDNIVRIKITTDIEEVKLLEYNVFGSASQLNLDSVRYWGR